MLITFQSLGGALQTEPLLLQQSTYRGCGHPMPLPGQLGGQVPQRLRRPTQWRHRITALVRLDQSHQRRNQTRINSIGAHPPTTRAPNALIGQRPYSAFEFEHALADGRLADPGCPRDQANATVADYRLLQKRLGTTRNIVVTPRNSGNEVTVDAIKQLGPNARGVAIAKPNELPPESTMPQTSWIKLTGWRMATW